MLSIGPRVLVPLKVLRCSQCTENPLVHLGLIDGGPNNSLSLSLKVSGQNFSFSRNHVVFPISKEITLMEGSVLLQKQNLASPLLHLSL